MQVVKLISGGTTQSILDFKLSATVVEGQPVNSSAAGGQGGSLDDPTTTDLTDMLGIVLAASSHNPHGGGVGTLTYSTTQGDTEGLVRVICNPDAVVKARMSGGATSGTSLAQTTNSVAETAGTVVTITTGDPAPNSPTMDEGIIWCVSGNNFGQSRRITAVAATTATVTVPFLRDIEASSVFILAPYMPGVGNTLQLTSDFLEADATIAVGTGGAASIVELVLNLAADSHVYWLAQDHFFNQLS